VNAALLVFLGAGIGGVLRHGVNLASLRLLGPAFPWATLGVNVGGSFLMGLLAGWLAVKAAGDLGHPIRLFLATGVLGGFTTFSAFSLDAVILWQRGETGLAMAYMGGSVILSIAGLVGGLALVRTVT
jgi:CrcB protein